MTLLCIIHIIVLTIIAFRIMLFTRSERHKPIISVLAYITMVSALSEAIASFAMPLPVSFAEVMMNAALALALLAHKGNVAELFKATQKGSKLSRLLCWTHEKKHFKTKTNRHHEVNP
ncbi:phage holin family protein [Shewanella sp.]|uniref:phage holin family protein n=1 Tax=Shewanella sp. TaxID=50422 RepID=UPI0035645CCA